MKKAIFVVMTVFLILGSNADNALSVNWYVDNAAMGSNNGTSWADAWNSFGKVVWGAGGVQAGDTLYISGGTTSKKYSESLSVKASGISGSSINIRIGQEPGHDGMVIIDLAYASNQNSGIFISNNSYINISGQVGSNPECRIKVTRAYYNGLLISGSAHDLNVSYLEITRNGAVSATQGVSVRVTQHPNIGEIHHCAIHDNYADEVWLFANSGASSVTSYGSLKFHHNDIYDWHADAVKISLGGVDFYNNTIRDRGTYRADHPDGIQAWSSYLRVFNNNFYNFIREDDNNLNSYIRYNPDNTVDPNPKHVMIYNNLFTERRIPLGGSVFRGIELSPDLTCASFSYIYFTNNIVKGVPTFALYVGMPSSAAPSSVQDIMVVNNIFQDVARKGFGSAVLILSNGGGTISYGSYGSGAKVVVDYNLINASSDEFLTNVSYGGVLQSYNTFKSNSGCQVHDVVSYPLLHVGYKPDSKSPVRGAGVPLSAYFTTDKDGNSRPVGSNWDLGPYQYVPSNIPTVTGVKIND